MDTGRVTRIVADLIEMLSNALEGVSEDLGQLDPGQPFMGCKPRIEDGTPDRDSLVLSLVDGSEYRITVVQTRRSGSAAGQG